MSGKPAARLGDPTACPKPGHGTNPIASGSPNVRFDGLPAARQGDPSACGGALSGALVGNVLINGKPAAVVGSVGSHGNVVIGGSGTVIIGNSPNPAPVSAPSPLQIAGSILAAVTQPAALLDATRLADSGSSAPLQKLAETLLEEEEEEEELPVKQGITLRIGVFFDGTGNNATNTAQGAECRAQALGLDESTGRGIAQRCHAYKLDPNSSYANDVTNIWRLYDLYRDEQQMEQNSQQSTVFAPIYIDGIGTTSGEMDSTLFGQALGVGSTGILAKIGEGMQQLGSVVQQALTDNPNKILDELKLDIFGFSRGAAAARGFANQVLTRQAGPLGGLPIPESFDWQSDLSIGFIGLFDTVSALDGPGPWGSPANAMAAGIDLHLAPDAAEQVIHLVARDEYRKNFPLNRVAPPHREIVLPGAHSDLGGGYAEEMRECLYPVRPRSQWVEQRVDARRTAVFSNALEDTRRVRSADLIDPEDSQAQLTTDVWEHSSLFGGGRNETRKQVIAAPILNRRVYGHLSRVYLRVIHMLAIEAGVPLDIIDDQDARLALPADIKNITYRLLSFTKKGSGVLSGEEERLLRQRYIHISSHWNAAVGSGGGLLDAVFINAPKIEGIRRCFGDELEKENQ